MQFDRKWLETGTVADNADVYATATAGTAGDAVAAGDRVKNAKFASADGTPSGGCTRSRARFMDGGVAT
jgi:hypothetical protein